jgi:hypothetical protein
MVLGCEQRIIKPARDLCILGALPLCGMSSGALQCPLQGLSLIRAATRGSVLTSPDKISRQLHVE